MRILHVVSTGQRRGGETFAAELISALDRQRMSQHVAILRGRDGLDVSFSVPTSVLDDSRGRLPGQVRDAEAVHRLRQLVRRYNPDLIQAHGGEAAERSVLATLGRKEPVIYRKIGVVRRTSANPIRAMHAALVKRTSCIVAVAEAVRRDAIESLGVTEDKIITVPNGIDARRIRAKNGRQRTREALAIPPESTVILSLVALAWEKNPRVHLQISESAIKSGHDVVHLVAGDGPLRTEVEEWVNARGLQQSIRILGNRTDVGDLIAASDLMIHASRPNGMEGMPACLIEAGISGLPVAAFAVAGISEVVEHGTTGLLADPDDHDALIAAAIQLIESDTLRARMGNAARARCTSRYDIQAVAKQYQSIYEAVSRERYEGSKA